jgi:hypothetical protein
MVDGACDHTLPGTSLSRDEDGHVNAGCLLDDLPDLQHLVTAPEADLRSEACDTGIVAGATRALGSKNSGVSSRIGLTVGQYDDRAKVIPLVQRREGFYFGIAACDERPISSFVEEAR